MTSKFTSRIVCTHNPNKGDFEFGGVSLRGGHAKLRRTTVRQGDIWINGLFPEDDSFTRNCDTNPMSFQTSPDCYITEHSEVDWISKEIAYQDLICNEKTNYCPDVGSGKLEPSKEEHDMDIVSTLATIAALLRDWCVLEPEFTQPIVDEPIERFNSMSNEYHDGLVWINDSKGEESKVKKDVSMQGDVLKGSYSNVAWDVFIQERLRSQKMMCHAYLQSGAASSEADCASLLGSDDLEDLFDSQKYVDIGCYPEEKAKQEIYPVKHFLQPFDKPVEVCNVCIDNQCLEGDSVINKDELSFAAHPFVEVNFKDQFAHHHAGQRTTASNYSYGCEGGRLFRPKVGEIFPVGSMSSAQMENHLVFGGGLILAESNGGNKVVDGDAGKVVPVHILDEEKCSPSTSQNLGSGHGASSILDLQTETKNDRVVVELVNEAMPFVLPYVCLQGLLAMEGVCRSFRDWIKNDPLLWQQLHVEPPLSRNLTDDVLLELSSRAKGQLRCLNLVDCTKVTEAAVEQVVSSNLKLTKVSLFF
ncbi:hypothetical protein L7F22_005411 [Adiantum nelumboides]|nr:hypothetical protein [Adiantum nelumboides]